MAANSGCYNDGEHESLEKDVPFVVAANAQFEPSASTNTTAVQTVLNTYELLEQTLLLLPLQKLHSIQRVARSWQALVEKSHRLSQAMFLIPSSQPIVPNTSISDHVSYNTHFKLNPVFLAETDCPEHERHFAFRSLQAMAQSLITQRHTHDEVQISMNSGWLELLVNRGHDSHRRMYITQPPITQLEMVVYRRETAGVRKTCRFTASGGLR